MLEASDNPMIEPLRSAHDALAAQLAAAEREATIATRRKEDVRSRYQSFREQLTRVCEAAGIPIADVLDRDSDGREPSSDEPPNRRTNRNADTQETTSRTSASAGPAGESADRPGDLLRSTIALPCRPRTQRWYAGQALHRLGGEAAISDVASDMRHLGYEHGRVPARSDQLEQSLAALPTQVAWVGRGGIPGSLCLLSGVNPGIAERSRSSSGT